MAQPDAELKERMMKACSSLAFACTLAIPVAGLGLTIVPTWDSTITNDPNGATIEATITEAINLYQTFFADPITVRIKFQEFTTSGLVGQSNSWNYIVG